MKKDYLEQILKETKNTNVMLINLIEVLSSREEGSTKQELSTSLGTNERQVRGYIRDARKMGVPIVSSSQERGYYIAQTQDDIQKIIADYKSRAKDMWDTAERLSRLVIVDDE